MPHVRGRTGRGPLAGHGDRNGVDGGVVPLVPLELGGPRPLLDPPVDLIWQDVVGDLDHLGPVR